MPEHCESGGMHRCVERASQEKSAESRTSPETWISVCKRLAMRHKANMKHARPQETQGEPACAGIYHPAICVWQSTALLPANTSQSRHRAATVIQSDTKGEVKKRCTNNPLRSDSDGSERKYIFLRLDNPKPSKNRPSHTYTVVFLKCLPRLKTGLQC